MTNVLNTDLEMREMSDECFQKVVRLAKENWGLDIEEGKRPLVTARLFKRVQSCGSRSFSDFLEKVYSGGANECDNFISALTTNVTQFFREYHHFDFLEQMVFPELKCAKNIKIWSAGCSTGQEPYSIASVAQKVLGERCDVRILATDVDSEVLKKALIGEFNSSDVGLISGAHKKALFEDGSGSVLKIRFVLRNMIDFRRLNLFQSWPLSGEFDVIFCRNVSIYFDKKTQEKIWTGFSNKLKPGGYLFIGHSERINCPENIGMKPVGITTYKKLSVYGVKHVN